MKYLRFGFIAACLAILLVAPLAFSQAPISPSQTVFSISPSRSVKVLTLTAQGAGTVNSADQPGFGVLNLLCVFNTSAQTGTPSTTFSIQNKDVLGSGLYYSIITTTPITAINTP